MFVCNYNSDILLKYYILFPLFEEAFNAVIFLMCFNFIHQFVLLCQTVPSINQLNYYVIYLLFVLKLTERINKLACLCRVLQVSKEQLILSLEIELLSNICFHFILCIFVQGLSVLFSLLLQTHIFFLNFLQIIILNYNIVKLLS